MLCAPGGPTRLNRLFRAHPAGETPPEACGAAVAGRRVVQTMRLSMKAFGLRLGAPALVGVAAIVVAALAAGAWKLASAPPAAGVGMPERLRAIAAATDPQTNLFQNGHRARARGARRTAQG